MRRVVIIVIVLLLLGAANLLVPEVRSHVRRFVRPAPTPAITPLPLSARAGSLSPRAAPTPSPTTALPSHTALAATPAPSPKLATPTATTPPTPSPTREEVIVNGLAYDAYIPAALTEKQVYQYSCEFDAAWVILETYGIPVSVDELITIVGVDDSIEPYIEETDEGFIIHGGDITTALSGDYTSNFLARSTGSAMRKAFEHFGLRVTPVHDRAGVEQALDQGQLIWMKTTVDFNVWRPALWRTPDGTTIRTVLGNDHAVVVMGYNDEGVVIRDVLGPTSSNWNRPYEYAVAWNTFLTVWEAQSFDGLAVAPPSGQ